MRKNKYALRLFTNEVKVLPCEGRNLVNWYITMAKLCQGKSSLKQVRLTGSLLGGSIRAQKTCEEY